MEVKVFTKILKPKQGFLPSSVSASNCGLESEINLWLAANPNIEIKNITQSQSGGSFAWASSTIVVSVWYQ